MDPERLANLLDGRLADLQRRAGIPGVSVAIVWDDGRRWLGAAGSADIATGAPMTTGTGFAFASVSKTLTAAVVLQLVEEGTLSLDQTVAPLLPTYRLDRRITVRMLLDHTSGLPDFFLNPKIDKPLQAKPDAVWTPQRTWTFVIAKRPVPGTVWQYSNSNYLLLGELVKAVTGRTLANEIRDRLLDPLALETAWYQAAEEPRVGGATGYRTVAKAGGAIRYVAVAPASGIMPFRSVVTAAGGAGSIAATALDAARWMGAFAGGSILAPDMQAAMIDDAARTSALGSRIPYGLGIQVVTLDGRRALGHSGRYLGFRNTVMYVPEARLSIAVLTNQGTYNPATIAAALMPIVSRRPSVAPIPAPSSPAPSVAPSDAPIPQPSAAAP
jgi:D-alanyl-D-alanine carboxypeptidase